MWLPRFAAVGFFLTLALSQTPRRSASLHRRDSSGDVCDGLTVSSNIGDRKVAVVVDSSGSMASYDPYGRRQDAGRALNDFLISEGEADGDKKADLITVVDFDYYAVTLYPLGDPGDRSANESFSKIDADGGTNIGSGVEMAIENLNSGGGSTDKRSAIVVFTDGQDYSTALISAIETATSQGIRVSFGFLDPTLATQSTEVLQAIKESRGVYATISDAGGSRNFINYVILNGLTYNDNAQGYPDQLLAGLAETHFISNSDVVTLKYLAEKGEMVSFAIASMSAGELEAIAVMAGTELGRTMANDSQDATSYVQYNAFINVTAPSSGQIELKISADGAITDGMFSVHTTSNVPFRNCTVGVWKRDGLSPGVKGGIAVGVIVAVGLLVTAGYFGYRYFRDRGGNGVKVPAAGRAGNHGVQDKPGFDEKLGPRANIAPIQPSLGTQDSPPDVQPSFSSSPFGNGYSLDDTEDLANINSALNMPEAYHNAAGRMAADNVFGAGDGSAPSPVDSAIPEDPTSSNISLPSVAFVPSAPLKSGASKNQEQADSKLKNEEPNTKGTGSSSAATPPADPSDTQQDRIPRPRICRSNVDPHHHHAWTPFDPDHPEEWFCQDEECELNQPGHICMDKGTCMCKCRENDCAVSKKRREG